MFKWLAIIVQTVGSALKSHRELAQENTDNKNKRSIASMPFRSRWSKQRHLLKRHGAMAPRMCGFSRWILWPAWPR